MAQKQRWSTEAILLLINAYKEEKFLYTPSSQHYHNKTLRRLAFKRIADIVQSSRPNTTDKECACKFHNLRTQFHIQNSKYKASLRSGNETDNIFVPTVWYYKNLMFLDEFVSSRKNKNSMECIDDEESLTESENYVNSQIDDLEATQSKRRKLQNSQEPGQLSSMHETTMKQLHETEEYYRLAVSWANILKTMGPEQRMFATKFINDILCRGQLGALHMNSIVINGPTVTQASFTHTYLSTASDVTDSEMWSPQDIESLISLVQIHNVIYDQSHPDYAKSEIVEKHWQQISSLIKKTSKSCLKKWQVLSSEYKQRKNNQSTNSQSKTNEWPYFNTIDFLKDYLPEVSYDKSTPVDNITTLHDDASDSKLPETGKTNSQINVSPEKILFNEKSSDDNVDIKIEIEEADGNHFVEIQDHSENDMSNDGCNILDMDYLDNEIYSNSSLHETESYSKTNGKNIKTDSFTDGKCNSMKLFLLNLADDASSLSKSTQRKFQSIILNLLEGLE